MWLHGKLKFLFRSSKFLNFGIHNIFTPGTAVAVLYVMNVAQHVHVHIDVWRLVQNDRLFEQEASPTVFIALKGNSLCL